MTLILLFITLVLLTFSGILLSNVLTFPRLKTLSQLPEHQPFISILIPARNESAVIENTVRAHLSQTYQNFELLVLDDNSTDGTGKLAQDAGAGDSRLRVLSGVTLPEGWTGKNHACHVLSQHARGEILLFTDADVQWQPEALAALIIQMQKTDADLFTVWSTQVTKTPAERLVVPLMAFAILNYLPAWLVHHTRISLFAAANGQCMAWRKDTYLKIGGHTGVRNNVLEDVTLARIARQNGLRLRMSDGANLIRCRMYEDWQSVRDGFAKNILAGYGNNVLLLMLATIFHLVIFVLPWFMLLLRDYRQWAALVIGIGILLRALSAAFSRQRILDAVFMPISVMLMTCIAHQAIYWHYTGGVRWKGRLIAHKPVRSIKHG